MSRTDRANRRLELKLVFWGPARSGKTTALRSLHGACDPRLRGEFASVESDSVSGEPTCYFDYAPLDLPRFRDYTLRADCFTVPGRNGFDATRRRLLRGADAIVFVGDVSSRDDRNVESWRALCAFLDEQDEDPGDPIPIIVVANKRDLAASQGAALLMAQLMETCHERAILAAVDAVATSGMGLMKALHRILVAGAERVLERIEPLGSTVGGSTLAGIPKPAHEGPAQTYRRLFVDALESQFGGASDGVSLERVAPRRTVSAGAPTPREKEIRTADTQVDLDTGEINTAVEASRWLALRDGDVNQLRRERALSRLLADVGTLCSQATEVESVIRRILVQLIMNLDAVTGWIAIPHAVEGEQVFDSMGRARDAAVVAEAAQALGLGLSESGVAAVGAAATAGFPGGAAGGDGLYLQFPITGSQPGWMLLVGAPGRGLPEDAQPVLRTAATLLGLTAARINCLVQLNVLHRSIEDRVEERTFELRRQKSSLEDRVLERERELENAKRAALETERSLFDQERQEGVQQLAAGVAHELNNPISAICADVQYALEAIEERGELDESLSDVHEALVDALEAARQVGARVTSLYGGEIVRERRASVRTNLGAALLDGINHVAQSDPTFVAQVGGGATDVFVGVPVAELTRWFFRLFTSVRSHAEARLQLQVFEDGTGPGVRMITDGQLPPGGRDALGRVRSEIQQAGGRLGAEHADDRMRIELRFPRACGGAGVQRALGRTA